MNMIVITQSPIQSGPCCASRVEDVAPAANSGMTADPHRESLDFDDLTPDERAELLRLIGDAFA